MQTINLEDFTQGAVRNLTGQERGVEARKIFKLDDLDVIKEDVQVVVPDDLDAITTSFFQGMFAQSVRALNDSGGFLNHYRFHASPFILEQIMRGIDRVNTKRGAALH